MFNDPPLVSLIDPKSNGQPNYFNGTNCWGDNLLNAGDAINPVTGA
jgi:hypothetical protein